MELARNGNQCLGFCIGGNESPGSATVVLVSQLKLTKLLHRI
jgi:hypothetical protein